MEVTKTWNPFVNHVFVLVSMWDFKLEEIVPDQNVVDCICKYAVS